MKKILSLIAFLVISSSAFAADNFNAQSSESFDKDNPYGSEIKMTELTKLRYKAFEEASINISPSYDESKKFVKLYVLSDDGKSIHRAKMPDAKIVQYTNNTYSIRFNNDPDIIYYYSKDGELTSFVNLPIKTKAPYYAYYYNTDGVLQQIEVKPDRYHSYFYGLDGLLIKYGDYDNFYDVAGKLIYRKRPVLSL